MNDLIGYDFSHWQNDRQYEQYSAYGKFMIHKLTEGRSYVDPKAYQRITTMLQNPKDYLPKFIGVYHFYNPNETYNSNAANFITACYQVLSIAANKNVPIVPIIDWEHGELLNDKQTINLYAFIQAFWNEFNVSPMLYTSQYYLNRFGIDKVQQMGVKLWVARWGKAPEATGMWDNSDICIWQYTSEIGTDSQDANKLLCDVKVLPNINDKLRVEVSDVSEHCCSCCQCGKE